MLADQVELSDIVAMMEHATYQRRLSEQAMQQLNIDAFRSELAARLRKAAELKGESLSGVHIDAAIDAYLDGLYRFRDPEPSLRKNLLTLYVKRKEIGKRYGIPAALAAAAGALIFSGYRFIDFLSLKAKETNIEQGVEFRCQLSEEALSRYDFINNRAYALGIDDRGLAADLSSAIALLDEAEEYCREFAPDGNAKPYVNTENYEEAGSSFSSVDQAIASANQNLSSAQSILDIQEQSIEVRDGLDSLIGQIRTYSNPQQLLDNAERSYTQGLNYLDGNNPEAAAEELTQLEAISEDLNRFAVLPTQAKSSYDNIMVIVQEEPARVMADQLYDRAEKAEEQVIIPDLESSVSELHDLEQVLKQEYVLTVVSRPGEYTGVEREYNGRTSGFYIIVEALDPNGTPIAIPIVNEETGAIQTVTIWGEEVPECMYQRIGSDKQDNGMVDDNVMGLKQIGYLQPKMTMLGCNNEPFQRKGQITEW